MVGDLVFYKSNIKAPHVLYCFSAQLGDLQHKPRDNYLGSQHDGTLLFPNTLLLLLVASDSKLVHFQASLEHYRKLQAFHNVK